MHKLTSGQKIILNQIKGQKADIELMNRDELKNTLIVDVDPYSMTFILKLKDRTRVMQMKNIFHIDVLDEPVPEVCTETKTYAGGLTD